MERNLNELFHLIIFESFIIINMRALLSTILICCFTLVGFAQEDDKMTDVAKELSTSRDRLILELNYTGLANAPEALDVRWFSRGLNFYYTYDFPIGDSKRFSFAPGIGLSFHNYYTNSSIETDSVGAVANFSFFQPISDDIDFSKNKFNTNSIEIPIELRFRTLPDNSGRSFKLGIGFRGARLLSSKTKYRGPAIVDGVSRTVKVKDLQLLNMPDFRYGPSFRIGYGEFSLVGYFALNSIFEPNFGSDIRAFSIGISFNSF